MGIFQHDDGTRLIKDIDVSHDSHVGQQVFWVVVRWKVIGEQPVEVAVLRSERDHADVLEELLDRDSLQVLVYDGDDTVFQDQTVDPGVDYDYSLFAQAPDGSWHKQHHFHLKTDPYDDGQAHLMALDRDYQRSYCAFVDKVWPGFREGREDVFPGVVRERWPGREDADD